MEEEHMMLSLLLCKSLQIRARHVALSSTVRQWSFQGINVDLVTDPSLKSIKGNLYPKIKRVKN